MRRCRLVTAIATFSIFAAGCAFEATDADDTEGSKESLSGTCGNGPCPGHTNLVPTATVVGSSNNFTTASPVSKLWDGCVLEKSSCMADAASSSYYVDLDLGGSKELSFARLHGDVGGSFESRTWSLQYRASSSDAWTTAFSGMNAYVASWVSTGLSITARYLRVKVSGNSGGTSARELEIYGTAAGISRYVSPAGSGTACSSSSPCSLTTGLSQAAAGESVVLGDGVYATTLQIKKGGVSGKPITVRAKNQGKAIVQNTSGPLARIWASYVIVRGIVFDGKQTGGNRGAVRIGAGDEVTLSEPVHHVSFEQNVIRNARAACMSITTGEHDVIVRYNTISGCGWQEFWGEALYLGSKYYPDETVYNLEIHDNDFSGFTENGLETKNHSKNIVIHHNRFHDQALFRERPAGVAKKYTGGNEGTLSLGGALHKAYANLFYDNKADGGGQLWVTSDAGHEVYNNVVFDSLSGSYAVKKSSAAEPGGQPPSRLYNNTFFHLHSHSVSNSDPAGLVIRNNLGLNASGNVGSSSVSASHFVDAANGDFHLTGVGAAIDYATTSPYAPKDFDGRAAYGARDAGAFEYVP